MTEEGKLESTCVVDTKFAIGHEDHTDKGIGVDGDNKKDAIQEWPPWTEQQTVSMFFFNANEHIFTACDIAKEYGQAIDKAGYLDGVDGDKMGIREVHQEVNYGDVKVWPFFVLAVSFKTSQGKDVGDDPAESAGKDDGKERSANVRQQERYVDAKVKPLCFVC